MRLYNPQRHEMPIRLPRGEDGDLKVKPYSSIQLFPGEEKVINASGVWQLLEDDEDNPPRPDHKSAAPAVYIPVPSPLVTKIKRLSSADLKIIRALSDAQLADIKA
jgi:hypothetical protein